VEPVLVKGADLSVPRKAARIQGLDPLKSASRKVNVTFIGVLEAIGKGFEKGLVWAVRYAVPVEKLVATLFPSTAPVAIGIADATTLLQNAVLMVEQKYSAAGKQSGTGSQKLADVMLLVGPVVTQLLKQAGVEASAAYVQNLASAVVAILNVQSMPTTTAA
jgi:hypothetical protein